MLQKLMISISHAPYTNICIIESSVDDHDEVVFEWQDGLKDVLLKVSLDKISILFPCILGLHIIPGWCVSGY